MPEPCLLTYGISTYPQPLQTGTSARIDVAVLDPAGDVFCDRIIVAVPVGTDAGSLCSQAPTAAVNTSRWDVLDGAVQSGSDLGLPGPAYVPVILRCREKADYRIDYPLVLTLTADVDTPVGEVAFMVQENSGTSDDSMAERECSFELSKDTPVFYLQNFVAIADASSVVPASEFGNGAPIWFRWESNGTWFQLYAKGSSQPLYAGSQQTFHLPDGMATSTTFVLAASVTGDPGSGSADGYIPIYLYNALTLTVSNPTVTAKSVLSHGDVVSDQEVRARNLTISDSARCQSTLTAQRLLVLTDTTNIGSLNVGSPVKPAKIYNTGGINADTLTVTGTTTLDDTRARLLHVQGPTTTGPLTADSVTSTGTLSAKQGNTPAVYVTNASAQFPTIWASNTSNTKPANQNAITGAVINVGSSKDIGVWTNGSIVSTGRRAMLTHLPTDSGPQVMTSPLSVAPELHVTGAARLRGGRAAIQLARTAAAAILHTDAHAYRVLLTPTAHCNGLAVTEKTPDGFVVEELGGGTSDAGFDWLVVARIADPDGDGVTPLELPERLPEPLAPTQPDRIAAQHHRGDRDGDPRRCA